MRVGLAEAAIAPAIFLRNTQALAVAGGADSYWVPDHLINIVPSSVWKPRYTGTARLVPKADAFLEPWTVLGFMAGKTRLSRLRLGVGVTDAGRRHPAVTAQAAATLHLLSRGRAILGIGTGERESNAPYGVDWRKPVGRFEEAVAIIRTLWDSGGEPVNRPSPWFPLENAIFDVPPYRGGRPPVWIAAHGPRMLGICGRYGDAWYPAWPQTSKEYGEKLGAVRTAASDAGRDPTGIIGAGWFLVFLGATRGMVDDVLNTVGARLCALTLSADHWARHGVEHPMGPGFTGLQDLLPQLIDEEHALAHAERVPEGLLREAFVSGTVNEVTERFAAYGDQGLTHPVIVHASIYFHLRAGMTSVPSLVRLLRTLRRM